MTHADRAVSRLERQRARWEAVLAGVGKPGGVHPRTASILRINEIDVALAAARARIEKERIAL